MIFEGQKPWKVTIQQFKSYYGNGKKMCIHFFTLVYIDFKNGHQHADQNAVMYCEIRHC